jgi:diaminohydroxyphosphoribosylaminopyrimidine deaminase / 5-amino-6-(5-phosphoribosylamino)uracil reductase
MKHDHSKDEFFMQRVFQLAANAKGNVSPNPLVGCVIVHNDLIIGEGFHKQYGGPHAEVNAVNSVTNESLLGESTIYVNLEPCSHFGKTPPCADLLIRHQVKKVVISNMDNNPKVAGEGIKKLRNAGIEVVTGILANEGKELNKRFFTFMEKQRPYIILKWAQTADGFIAQENYDSKWISNEYSRQLVHKWRAEEDAILVGRVTVAHDNPSLNVREWTGKNPVRIVIDRFLKLDEKLKVFDGTQKTLCYNLLKHEERTNLSLLRVDENNFTANVLSSLWKNQIQSIIVEGGATTLKIFLENNQWDEVRVFKSPRTFQKGIPAPVVQGKISRRENISGDQLEYIHPL